MICQADSVLRDVFLYIINGRTDLLKPVDTIRYEDLMGLSAWVDEKRVLIGNRDLMINHSIAVPKRGYEDPYHADGYEVVYLAREGELYAAFILEFTAADKPLAVLDMMRRRGLCAAVRSVDACITPALLERVFGLHPKKPRSFLQGCTSCLKSAADRVSVRRPLLRTKRATAVLCGDGSGLRAASAVRKARASTLLYIGGPAAAYLGGPSLFELDDGGKCSGGQPAAHFYSC